MRRESNEGGVNRYTELNIIVPPLYIDQQLIPFPHEEPLTPNLFQTGHTLSTIRNSCNNAQGAINSDLPRVTE